ncbi:MAG: FAD-dependent oxidoreductase [Sporichthyaceae bacterium]
MPLELDDVAAPTLGPDQLALLEPFGTRRAVEVGDVLYAAGDDAYDFFVLLSATVEIVSTVDGVEQVLVSHGAGRFLGELNLLTGQRVYLTARVAEAGDVLVIPAVDFRRLVATVPALSDVILAALTARRSSLIVSEAARSVRVVGSRYAPTSLAMREFLSRNRLPHDWLDADLDPGVCRLVDGFCFGADDLPLVIVGDTVLRRATPGQVAQHLGLTIESIPQRCFDLVVVGAGPSGLAATVYGVSEGLSTLLVESVAPGGQAGTSSRIENYLGFPNGVSGQELTDRAMTQALKFGARITTPCEVVGLRECAGHLVVSLSDGTELAGRAVVAATGAHYRRLPVEGLDGFEGTSIYYAATATEARLVADKPVVIVGGGNSAGQAAMFLAETGCHVSLVVRGKELGASMSRYLAARIEATAKIEVMCGTQVVRLHGAGLLEGVTTACDGAERDVHAAALFSFIGATPNSGWLSGCAAADAAGFVRTDRSLGPEDLGDAWSVLGRAPYAFETGKPGLFAVGDVRSDSVKRVASAVGEGSAAVHSVHRHLAYHV